MTGTSLDRAVKAAQWWLDLQRTTNPVFLPLMRDEHRYLVLMGGAGSGKSVFAARKILERAVSEPGHRFLVVRKVGNTLRESCWHLLCSELEEYYPNVGSKVNKTDMTITLRNGSQIIFKGLDDVEKLKSIDRIDGIWVEEASELLESDFNQLDIRLRGVTRWYKQIIVTFNPTSILHWLKTRFFDLPRENVRTLRTTYRDNRFLDDEAKQVLESFRDVDPYYYQVYCLGEWGITGKSVFDARAVSQRLATLEPPAMCGEMEYDYDGSRIGAVKFVPSAAGSLEVYAPPRDGIPYVIGADTAGDGSDSFVAQVLDNTTGEQVARWRRKSVDEDVFTHDLYALGAWYNFALIAPEVNFSTYPVMELERLQYPKLYVRETVDDYTHKYRHSYGFVTNSKTRPVIIAELIKTCRDDPALGFVHDRATLEEMATFVRDENWRAEAEDGAHDDCVMALAIANHARAQQDYIPAESERPKWSQEQWEDYRAANADERRRIIEAWGPPR